MMDLGCDNQVNMGFRKLRRSSQTPPGWRLASVRETEENLEWIKSNNLIEEWDRVRLLDGWMGGSGYNFTVEVGFRSCLGYMLVIESPTPPPSEAGPEISDADDRNATLYSKIPNLSEEGMNAAVLLCSEDSNEEVLYWLMGGKTEGNQRKAASEVAMAKAMRKWQSVYAKSREARTESSLAPGREETSQTARKWQSLNAKIREARMRLDPDLGEDGKTSEAVSQIISQIARKWQVVHAEKTKISGAHLDDLKIRFQKYWKELLDATANSLRALVNETRNPEQGRIIEEIQNEVYSVIFGSDQVFKNFGEEVVMERVWYVVVEKMAWQTFNILSRNLYGKVAMHSDPSLRNMIRYAYDYVRQALNVALNKADFERFPMFDCTGIEVFFGNTTTSPDVLSTFLLAAAFEADTSLVRRLIERGVQPSAVSQENGNSVLHYAAEMMHDSDRYKIAEMLLTQDANLADAIGWEHRTALHIAAKNGDHKMCEILLKHKASLTIKNSFGYTPLHMALQRSYDEVVRVLISAEQRNRIEGSARLVDVEENSGGTPVDYVIERNDVSMIAWLLSQSSQPESYFVKLQEHHPLSACLRESSRMGYSDLVQKLVDGGADPFQGDDEGKTALHHAAETEHEFMALDIIRKLLFDKKQGSINWRKVLAADKFGRNVLHVSAFLGRKELCRELLGANIDLVDTKDRDGQSALYYAVAGDHVDTDVLDLILEEKGRNQVFVKDFSQTTPLHVAAARGKLNMVEALLSEISDDERKKYVEATDVLGQTALHKAASGGHFEVVKMLLEEGADPLKERDSDGKTALDFAVQADGEHVDKIAKVLLSHYKSDKQKALLLFTSAAGIGGVSNSSLEEYLQAQKTEIEEKLGSENSVIRVAATLGDIDMTLECVTRGANIALIRDEKWIATLSVDDENNVRDVLKQIKTIVEQGTDKPALEDNLGRSPYAVGLAALFLNPFVKSPVAVGISGDWGMGKSSVMLQTESILLKTAAQLAFENSFQKSNLLGPGESELSMIGQGKLWKIANEIERLDAKVTNSKTISKLQKHWKILRTLWNKSSPVTSKTLCKFSGVLENYQPKNRQIFKCLAIMDRRDMFKEQEECGSRNQTTGEMSMEEDLLQGSTPSVLTVQYNAWQYRNETEAWAGLAVEITQELEATMTVAHKLRTNWIYNWKNRRKNICFGVILPFFFVLMVAIWFSTIVWLILDTGKHKDMKTLKYGGLPASIIVAVWGLVKSIISFVKPISSQVMDYICLPDHTQKLGYHQKVIDDINLLKENLYYKCSLKWEVFAFIWCCITWSWDENNVPGTKMRKMAPAFGDNLRMIVFVDDLDRCEENVILQILSAVNLVLATCHINVILGMDNSMIERAILRKYGNSNSEDSKSNVELAEKYMRKIVQLPLHLPDPSDSESTDFLKRQLGVWDSKQPSSAENAADTEKRTAHGRRKANPKFQIFSGGGRKEDLAESVNEVERTPGSSDANLIQQGSVQSEEQGTIEKAEGTRAEEAKIKIDDTSSIELPQDDQQQREGSKGKRSRMDDLSSIISAMLIPKYTPGERSAFRFLHTQCTGNRKLPREWKCLLAYHRLSWNILYLTFHQEDVNPVEGWQVQLIAWIFVCWEWRDLITILIKKWNKLEVLIKWKAEVGPSLREIVEHYIDEELPADKKSPNFQGEKKSSTKEENDAVDSSAKETDTYNNSSAEVERTSDKMATIPGEDTEGDDHVLRNILREQKEMMEALRKAQEGMNEVLRKVQDDMREVLKEQEQMREMLKKKVLKEKEDKKEEGSKENQTRKIKKFLIEEDMEGESSVQQYTAAEEREEWDRLRDALRRYNVSMDGIQTFQKFRFYCPSGHLPWPLAKQD